jgi:hypothetical protein
MNKKILIFSLVLLLLFLLSFLIWKNWIWSFNINFLKFSFEPSFEERLEKDNICYDLFKKSNFYKIKNEARIFYRYSFNNKTCILYFRFTDTETKTNYFNFTDTKNKYIIYDLLNKKNIYNWSNKESYDSLLENYK